MFLLNIKINKQLIKSGFLNLKLTDFNPVAINMLHILINENKISPLLEHISKTKLKIK